MLKIERLETAYGRIRVLKKVSLEIVRGEIITLLGANGAGKSTMMKTICGILSAVAGSVEYEGLRINRKSPTFRVRQGLVLVPEGRSILKRMSVHENLMMGAYTRSDTSAIQEDLEKVFNRFPVLRDRRRSSANVLSGGEQQMLAIGRALLSRPRLLMLDEPSLGLSPILVSQIFSIITDLHKEGITIFLVEQNAQKALQVADRGYVMETGSIVMCDRAENLLTCSDLRKAYLGG